MIVAVTGAAGGLGRALVRVLVGSGHQVRAAVRAPAQAELVSALGAEPVEVDVTRPETLPRLVEGAEVVHHLAAWMGRPPGLAEAVNVGGTRAVARACAAAGVRRLVHASSVAVYGPVTDGVVTEETPLRAVGDPYGDSKLASEAAAREALAGAATELVVLRPTMVYGPASGSWTLAPVRAIRSGLPVVLGDGSGLLDAVYVDDVAAAFAAAGEAPGVGGRAYNVCGEPVTVRELLGAYARMLGAPLRSVPVPLARAGAALAGRVTALLPGVDRFAPETLLTLLSRARFDGAAAARDLGYRPRVPLHEGLARTAAWLRQEGLAPGPRSALVVGAASGLGRAVALELARRYVRVYGADRQPGPAPERADGPGPVAYLSVDATSPDELAAAVAEVEAREGHLDMLVTTVGELRPGALEAQPWDDVVSQLELNALAPVLAARAAAPGMRARPRPDRERRLDERPARHAVHGRVLGGEGGAGGLHRRSAAGAAAVRSRRGAGTARRDAHRLRLAREGAPRGRGGPLRRPVGRLPQAPQGLRPVGRGPRRRPRRGRAGDRARRAVRAPAGAGRGHARGAPAARLRRAARRAQGRGVRETAGSEASAAAPRRARRLSQRGGRRLRSSQAQSGPSR